MSVEELRNERNGRTVPITKFYGDYKKYDKTYYAFVEGKDDPSYYRHIINNMLAEDYSVVLYPSSGKKNVAETYNKIDWSIYSKKRILFFMDRDLSDIISDPHIVIDENVYITENYSIENDFVCSNVLNAIMQDLLGFSSTPKEDIDKIIELFKEQKEFFIEFFMIFMANIIMWKRNNFVPANYSNVKIDDFILVTNGIISPKGSIEDLLKIFYKQSNVEFNKYNKSIVYTIIEEINNKNINSKLIRGKYISTFFILFCNSIYQDCEKIGIRKSNKGRKLNSKDIMETIAPRTKAPKSLRTFLNNIFTESCLNN